MENSSSNADSKELAHFSGQASRWWDRNGPLGALHDINPVRAAYIRKRSGIAGKKILDAGCGGGILAESLAGKGGRVTGIDLSRQVLSAARDHACRLGLDIEYLRFSAEDFARKAPESFDVVACMELIEHVPDPAPIISACACLARPGGDVFFSTINRTPAAYLLVILAAERLFGITEKGTHTYKRFVRPGELAGWARQSGLAEDSRAGIMYVPFARKAWLTRSLKMNYIMHFKKTGGNDV
ncbi:MAG: bifunctional 2-polyprenyl-6-hydroxyphenol methylase/3-demethylubiquinol 3-O-methyltransferase UbiG [Desulfosalsimonas sp.]